MSTSCLMSWCHLSIQVWTYVDIMSDVVKNGAPPFNSPVDICRHHVRCREKRCTAFQFSCRHMSTSCPKVVHHLSIQLSTYVDIMSGVVVPPRTYVDIMSDVVVPPFNSGVDICRNHVRCGGKAVHHLSIHLSTYVDIMSDVVKSGAPPFNSAVDICRHHVRCRGATEDICRHHV